MKARRAAVAIVAAGAAALGLGMGPARAAGPVTIGRDPLVVVHTNDNQVLVSCLAVGSSGVYGWTTILSSTLLIAPGGPCPTPPNLH